MLLVTIVYGLLALWILFLVFIDRHLKATQDSEFDLPSDRIDILVAARNEADNLPRLLDSITNSHYPNELLRVIIADDHSQDNTFELIHAYRQAHDELAIQYIPLASGQKGKKAALRMGLACVETEWVYFTDADCQIRSDTLTSMLNEVKNTGSTIGFGGVRYLGGNRLFIRLLQLENLNTMAVTAAFFEAGKGIMANAANMLVHKSHLAAYADALVDVHPGGDDVFFAQQVTSEHVAYNHSATAAVDTEAPRALHQLLEQRIRWASKTNHYKAFIPKTLAAFVFLLSSLQLICLASLLLLPSLSWLFISFILLKWFVECSYQSRWFSLLGDRLSWPESLALSMSYPLLVFVVGLASLSGRSFQWKDRTYRASSGTYSTSE